MTASLVIICDSMQSKRTRLLKNDRCPAGHLLADSWVCEALVQVNNWDMDTLTTFRSNSGENNGGCTTALPT